MSQAGPLDVIGAHPEIPTSIVTNSGTAVPLANVLEILGAGSIFTTGATNIVTVELINLTNHNVLVGAGTTTITKVPPSATPGIPLVSNGASLDPSFTTAVVAGGGTGSTTFTANSLIISNTTITGPLTGLGAATNGQLPIGSTGVAPVLATLTAGTGITVTNGAGTITIATSGSGTLNTLTGNTGGAISPTAGNINTLGTGSITIAGSGSTLTTQLTGLTNHSLLVGAGTATITNLGVATNGQLPIGSTGADPVLATITAGTGVTVTNGAGTITIAATAAGFTWTDVTGATQTLAVENGYITDRGGGVAYTLPASGALGDTIKIVGKAGLATITPNANQQIRLGSVSGTVGVTGTMVSNNAGDCAELICTTSGASTVWTVASVIGTWTIS